MTCTQYIQFLGTGAGDANFGTPQSVHLRSRDVRRFTCNLLSPDTLIDFNHQTVGALETFGVRTGAIKHLFVSHGHFDHFQPEEILCFAETLPAPLAVYGNTMVRDALAFCCENALDRETGRFVPRQRAGNIELNVLAPGLPVQVGELTVTPVLANHFMDKPYCIMEQQALNFLFEAEGKTVFYGLDSSYMLPATAATLAGTHLDVAILDATFGPRDIDPLTSGHLNWKMLDETIAELREIDCIDERTVIVADHLSANNVEPYDQVAGLLIEKGIVLAYDGLTLDL
jgi:L-ascorbate metabolism protein UlaG (beta-lactamase superfamily)